jgi:hypothetical protein
MPAGCSIPPQRFVTTDEAARAVGVPGWKLARLVRSGQLPEPAVRLGNQRGWSGDDVERARELLAGHDSEENGK